MSTQTVASTSTGYATWHTIRYADGTWQPNFGTIESQSSGGHSGLRARCSSADGRDLHVVNVGADNNSWHTIRYADGSWQSSFDLIPNASGVPSYFIDLECAGAGLDLHVIGFGNDGNLYHTVRSAAGRWQGSFDSIPSTGGPPSVRDCACGSADGSALQVVVLGSDGQLWHTIRDTGGTWQAKFDLIESQSKGGPTKFKRVACAGAGLALHVVGVGNDGQLWHTIRRADGTWEPNFVLIESQSRGGSSTSPAYVDVGCASADGTALQVVGLAFAIEIWHTIRYADGTWHPNFGLIETQSKGGPTFEAFSVACAGAGNSLHVAMLGLS